MKVYKFQRVRVSMTNGKGCASQNKPNAALQTVPAQWVTLETTTTLMWIRDTRSEAIPNRHEKLLFATLVDVLLASGAWYVLIELSVLMGVLPDDSVSTWLGCAVIAAVLPAAWFADHRESHENCRTLMCDGCHHVKSCDGQSACKCGGRYRSVAEMKWINSAE